jgi:hypothetical protein
MNVLEQLLAEWYQYKGYYVRQNVRVGKRKQGGYEGEVDIVAFNPIKKHLLHIEASTDTISWEKRDMKYEKKFRVCKTYIPSLFEGFELPELDQRVVLMFGSSSKKTTGGVRVILLKELMQEIYNDLKNKKLLNEMVPENYPLIRSIQMFISCMHKIEN